MASQDSSQPLRRDDDHDILDDTRRVVEDVRHLYEHVRREDVIGRYYRDNPYAVLATALGVGYVLGGGLFSPFTRRIMRVGMKALVIPVAAAQFKQVTQGSGLELNGQGSPTDS